MSLSAAASNRLHACHDCDLLVNLAGLSVNSRAKCPRCGALLAHKKFDSINRTLALSLTALLLFIPAATLPVMTIKLLGHANANTMLNGVVQLLNSGSWWMAFMVAFCSLIVPLLLLLLLFTTCLFSRFYLFPKIQIVLLKSHHHLKHWGMLDVYMLSLLVAIIKMKDLGDLQMGTGLYAFIVLMLLMVYAQQQFDSHECWDRLEGRSA
ncbi:paraquat-inducible protein A [Motiliproteus sp. MSK22-1]|uniref:paraquat-inducible protein A n=1 Tax=Motiliproteus sp. MSK22-1 TaxID=1897630 RepID=UPI00097854F2|nr:paraquat-inducible protein A [Motiliproteus sp. MSK22-1]OMH32670.1 hypothetical protein BGP75_14095 [Motiliproteus sp. MSK22-1]